MIQYEIPMEETNMLSVKVPIDQDVNTYKLELAVTKAILFQSPNGDIYRLTTPVYGFVYWYGCEGEHNSYIYLPDHNITLFTSKITTHKACGGMGYVIFMAPTETLTDPLLPFERIDPDTLNTQHDYYNSVVITTSCLDNASHICKGHLGWNAKNRGMCTPNMCNELVFVAPLPYGHRMFTLRVNPVLEERDGCLPAGVVEK